MSTELIAGKKEEVPFKGIFMMIAIVAVIIYFVNSCNSSKMNDRYALLSKQFPNSIIEQWSDLEFTVRSKVTLLSKKIIFDGKGNERVIDPIKVIAK